MAIEVRRTFESYEQWREFSMQNGRAVRGWRDGVLVSVREKGLVDPWTRERHIASDVVVDPSNLRESMSCAGLNSRKRAVLTVLEELAVGPGWPATARLKVLGAEGVTRAAMILRSLLPLYLGCEYLPTAHEQRALFPIPHLDLNSIGFEPGSFELFFSSDVFEHVPDLPLSLRQISKVLASDGALVSVFPFLSESRWTRVRARLVDGQVEHVLPPRFHGNPVRPEEGSLVYSVPGWDILTTCRANGFAAAEMILVSSSSMGIAATDTGGVFVLVAYKGDVPGRKYGFRPAADKTSPPS